MKDEEKIKVFEQLAMLNQWTQSHDKDAAERHTDTTNKFLEIFNFIRNRPCQLHAGQIVWLWSLVVLILGGAVGIIWWVTSLASAPTAAINDLKTDVAVIKKMVGVFSDKQLSFNRFISLANPEKSDEKICAGDH